MRLKSYLTSPQSTHRKVGGVEFPHSLIRLSLVLTILGFLDIDMTRMRFILCSCTLLLCGAIALSATSTNEQQVHQAFEVVEANTPLILQAGEDNSALILNNTTRPLSLTLAIVDSASESAPSLSSITEIQPKLLLVPPAGSGTVKIRVQPSDSLKPGRLLTGYVVAFEDSSNTVIRRVLQFAVPAKETTRPKTELTSLAGAMTTNVYYYPWRALQRVALLEEPLPLTSAFKAQEVDQVFNHDKTVGRLTAVNGETALVQYRAAQEGLPGGTTGLILGFRSMGHAGTYTGSLGVMGPEKKLVTLTVISKHYWIFPALAIAMGLLLYYLMQSYLNVVRKVWGLQEREAVMEDAFSKADEAFALEAKGKTYASYSISTDFERQSKDLLSGISRLKYKNFLRLDESSDEYKRVTKTLAELETVTVDWELFAATRLARLQTSLETARQSFAVVPVELLLEGRKEPALVTAAAGVLNGETQITIDAFKRLSVRIDDLLPRIQAWGNLSSRAEKVWRDLREMIATPTSPPKDAYDLAQLKEFHGTTFNIWRKLWVEETFDPKSLEEQLSELENEVAAAKSALPMGALVPSFTATAAISADGIAESAIARAEQIARKRLSLDLLYLALIVSVALYSGLVVNYFKVPFGTARDYLDVFVWGFGTKPLIDMVAAGIGKLWR